MEDLSAYIPIDRRLAISQGADLPERTQGAALFADISGFTPLTEALARELGAQRAAEQLTHLLNDVYEAVITVLQHYGGAVISFSGDAITCWLDQDDGTRAVTCALAIQKTMGQFSVVKVPSSKLGSPEMVFSLAVKAAVATGTVLRCVVGDPQILLIDALAGKTLERLVAAEHLAEKGEVVLEPQAIRSLQGKVQVSEWRQDRVTGERFGVVQRIEYPASEQAPALIPPNALGEEIVKSWLLAPIYERLRQGQSEFLAELRPVVALFISFTGIDYDQDEAAKGKLDAYIRWAQNILHRYKGHLLQLTVGDKGSYLYASFGAPITYDDDAIRAAYAALELRNPPAGLDYIREIKIGINQGRLYSGAYGALSRRTYGVLGDAVNLAARLMTAAQPGQIIAHQSIQQSTGSIFTWENLPAIRVKGKSDLIPISNLVGIQTHRLLRIAAPEYALPMVGREQEMATCEARLELALGGLGQIVGITGKAGLGKSRLVAQLIQKISMDRGVACYGGEAQSYAMETSYLAWHPIWRGLFEFDSPASQGEQMKSLASKLEAIDPTLVLRLPLLGVALNLTISDNELTASLDARLRKNSLEALLVDCLRFWAHDHPIVIVLEDCQWMDELSHDLLEVVGRAIADLPVFIIVAYRPPEALRLQKPRISALPNYTEVQLLEFTPEQAEGLIFLKLQQFSLEPSTIPHNLVERITAQAEGNPFYIEELLNYLHDQGINLQNFQALAQLDLPASLHSLILSRLDQLEDNQQITIKVASVIGRLFQAALLWGTFPELGGEAQVKSILESLSRLDLAAEDSSEQELTYFFKQIVTQQVAYENLPFATRASLHNQLARFIERSYSKSNDQFVDILALHFLKGENWSKALEYNLRAARRSQREFANDAAIMSCQRAMEAAERLGNKVNTLPERLALYEILGEVFMLVGQYEEALEHYAAGLKLLASRPDSLDFKRQSGEFCRRMAEVHERRSEYETAFELLDKGLVHLGQELLTIEASRIYLLGSGLFHRQGKNDDAILWNQRAQEIAVGINSREAQQIIAQANYLSGTIYWRRGDLTQSMEFCKKSIQLYNEIDDIVGLMRAYNNLGNSYADLGDWNQAGAAFQNSLSIAQQIGDIDQQGKIANNLALLYMDQGNWDEATRLFERGTSIYRQLGAALPEAVISSNLAQVLINRELLNQARQFLERSQTLFASVGSEDFLSELERRWGEYFIKNNEPDQALFHTRRSLELAIEQDARLDEGLSARLLGEVYLTKGDLTIAQETLLHSLQVLTEMKSEFEACRTILDLASLEIKTGTTDQTRAKIEQATQVFQRLGTRPEMERAIALQNQLILLSR